MAGSSSPLFKGLPKPNANHLTLYVLGPGFGESQVVSFPDGRWLVVDSFIHDGQHFTGELLRHFGVRNLDLLVITHADLDHIGGIDDLVSSFAIQKLWRYPGSGTLGDLLPNLLEQAQGTDPRLQQLRRALAAIYQLEEDNRAHEISVSTASWGPRSALYEVSPIAPTPHDLGGYRRALEKALVEWNNGKPELANAVKEFLLGKRDRLIPRANVLSVALSITWKKHRLLLGGDVEHPSDQQSGWQGVLSLLRADGREDLLRDLSVVKVAHHGSDGAFCEEAWKLHAGKARVKHALVTPFNRGNNPPPHGEALQKMSAYSDRLALTTLPSLALPPKGWLDAGRKKGKAMAPCVAIVMTPEGGTYAYLGRQARYFTRKG